MFNFELEHIVSDTDVEQNSELPSLDIPKIYGPDLNQNIVDFSIRYPNQPKPKEPNIGKILRKFE